MNKAHYIKIRKHHILITLQEYMNMDNIFKIFFSLVIAKNLTLGVSFPNKGMYCIIMIFSSAILQISDTNKKTLYPNNFGIIY